MSAANLEVTFVSILPPVSRSVYTSSPNVFSGLPGVFNNTCISRFTDLDEKCTFCKTEPETIVHLFCNCPSSSVFWKEKLISNQTGHVAVIGIRDITKFESNNQEVYHIINPILLMAKFHTHRNQIS